MALCFRVCAALLAVAGVISSTGSVAAQRILDGTPGVQIQVQTGYGFTGGANYRLLGPGLLPTDTVWVPLFITLSNNSATDINSGRLSVLDSSSPAVNNVQFAPVNFTLDVSLPAGAHKQVEMYVPAQDIGSSQLQVNLTNGNTTLASQQVSGQLQPGGALSIGVLSDDTATRTLLHSLTIGATTPSVAQFGASTPLDTLPQALSNFDIIVASNYSSDNLTSGQLAALRSWIQAGGTFLVAGGPDLLKTVRHLSRDLLPVVPNVAGPTAVDSNVAELAAFGGAVQGGGGPIEYSVARALPGAQVRLAHNGVPLIVDRQFGRGHLVYSALEPTLAPFNRWSAGAAGAFWQQMLGPDLSSALDTVIQGNNFSGSGFTQAGGSSSIIGDFNQVIARSLPSLQIYAVLILLYILIIGPGNFLVLRAMRRPELTWITLPVLSIFFGLASFALAYQRNGGDVVTRLDSIIMLDPGSPVRQVDSYVGVFVPYPGDYEVSGPQQAIAQSITDNTPAASGQDTTSQPMRADQGAPFHAWLYGMQMWTMRGLTIHQQVEIPGDVIAHLTVTGSKVGGDITNLTRTTFYDGAIVTANGYSKVIPRLAPGQKVHLSAFSLNPAGFSSAPNSGDGPLNNVYPDSSVATGLQASGSDQQIDSRRYSNILSSLFPSGSLANPAAPAYFIGWNTEHLVPIDVNGSAPHRQDLNLFIVPLSLELGSGPIKLDPGTLPVSVANSNAPVGAGVNAGITLSQNDTADLQLQVPVGSGHLTARTVTVTVNTSTLTAGSGTYQLFNWATHAWRTINLGSGTDVQRNAGALVSPDGRILLRITETAGSQNFGNLDQNVGIGLTGEVRP